MYKSNENSKNASLKQKATTSLEQQQLVDRIKNGDLEAKNRMVQFNQQYITKIAKNYSQLGIPLDDLVEAGNECVEESIKKFDASKGFALDTYLRWCIKHRLSQFIIDQGKMIGIPIYLKPELNRYTSSVDTLTQQLNRKPLPEEIAQEMNIPVDKVKKIAAAAKNLN